MARSSSSHDYIVVGAGSAGCAVAAGLAKAELGSILVIEAGQKDSGVLVKVPFGLIWLMGGRRDWRLVSAPQKNLAGRSLKIPRGKMLGGSGSINSMVWFRGRRDDFDNWGVEGWSGDDVWPEFEEVEASLTPRACLLRIRSRRRLANRLAAMASRRQTPNMKARAFFM